MIDVDAKAARRGAFDALLDAAKGIVMEHVGEELLDGGREAIQRTPGAVKFQNLFFEEGATEWVGFAILVLFGEIVECAVFVFELDEGSDFVEGGDGEVGRELGEFEVVGAQVGF